MEFFRSKLYYFDKTFDDIEANMLEDVNNTIKRDNITYILYFQ